MDISFRYMEDLLLGLNAYDYDISDDDEDKEKIKSNLEGMTPYVGMRVDVRDRAFVWSAGSILKLEGEEDSLTVTIRYDGWDERWDEIFIWPSVRLAQIFTYTREVKCLVDILPKKSSSLWPCKVQYRMPHPGVPSACDILRSQDNLFVKPYGSFPSYMKIENGGAWIPVSRFRFTPSFNSSKHKKKVYFKALEVALRDKTTNTISFSVTESGTSLLKDDYLIQAINQEPKNCIHFTKGNTHQPVIVENVEEQLSIKVEFKKKAKMKEKKESIVKSPRAGSYPTTEIYRGDVTDMNLPGWTHIKRKRLRPCNLGPHIDHYYLSPEKKYKLRSKTQVGQFIAAFEEFGDEDKAWDKIKR